MDTPFIKNERYRHPIQQKKRGLTKVMMERPLHIKTEQAYTLLLNNNNIIIICYVT